MNQRFVHATGNFVYSTVPHIEHPTTAKDSAVARMVKTFDELIADPDAGDGDIRAPLVVITAGERWWGKAPIDSAWRSSHEAMARRGPRRRLVLAEGSNHDIPAKRPDTIVAAVRSLRAP